MLISSKQLPIGRSQSWDTLGGNETDWERSESIYEQQARMAGRRNSLSYGRDAGGGWYEPPAGVRPPDLDLKIEPESYQESLYNQGYLDCPNIRNIRKSSVPELNSHYDRLPVAHRGSLLPHDYYQQDPGISPRPAEGFYRGDQPHPHPLNRSASHYGMMAGPRQLWEHSSGGRPASATPTQGLPPPPPPTAHEMGRIYREPFIPGPPPVTPISKMMQDGQRVPSRAPSPARYLMEPNSPRYGAEPPASLTSHTIYSDVNGRSVDPHQPKATCLVVDPTTQGMDGTARSMVMQPENPSSYTIQQAQQQAQQQMQQQIQQQQMQQQVQPAQQMQQVQPAQQMQHVQQIPQVQPVQQVPHVQPIAPPNPVYSPAPPTAPITTQQPAVAPVPVSLPPQPPASAAPQTPIAPVHPKFLAFLQKEGLSESTITSLLHQGFDSSVMLAVMEENDACSVAPNLGQARVLSRVVLSCKKTPEVPPASPQHPSATVRGRSNSFSHRGDIYVHQPPPMTPGVDSHYMQPPSTPMQTISPRMVESYGRRPSSAPSQQFLETSGYPGARFAGSYSGAMLPVQPRPLSACNPHAGLHMPPMAAASRQVAIPSHLPGIPPQLPGPIHAMPQPLPALHGVPQSMTISPMAPQQAPKAYTTNYTVPMELMKRDRSLAAMSTMPSPHVSPQVMRKAGIVASDGPLVPLGGAISGTNISLANQKLSRRTGPPVIVSTMASPDTS
ncbi:C-terminal-binding protein 2, partial [Triplophysa rosa]